MSTLPALNDDIEGIILAMIEDYHQDAHKARMASTLAHFRRKYFRWVARSNGSRMERESDASRLLQRAPLQVHDDTAFWLSADFGGGQ